MKNYLLIVCTLLTTTLVNAQFIKERSIDAAIGFGYTFPYDDVSINGSGLYLQCDYVLGVATWFELRPYAGVIYTTPEKLKNAENLPDYETTTKAFSLGGKARFIAPIPWVAPYIELGVGASIGAFRTFTPYTNIDKSGVVVDFPWSIGLEIGRQHKFNIAFNYLDHISAEQVSGALSFGYSFPLDSKK